MSMFHFIIWSFDPEIFSLGILAPRWYGVLFALGFVVSQIIMTAFFRKEGKPPKHVEYLTTYMVLATIIGARLGHCLFYNPEYYLANPLDIFKVWEGGLASHGGALGILLAIYLFCKKYKYNYLWLFDRLVIVVLLTGALIRIGNFFNSEMEGTLTQSEYGVVYARSTYEALNFDEKVVASVDFSPGGKMTSSNEGEFPVLVKVTLQNNIFLDSIQGKNIIQQFASRLKRRYEADTHISFGGSPLDYKTSKRGGKTIIEISALGKARHPAQLYEAFYCLVLMLLLYWIWSKKRAVLPRGFNFSLFLILLWSLRFADEFFKLNQVSFEENLPINMGQILSIPLMLTGVILMIWVFTQKPRMNES